MASVVKLHFGQEIMQLTLSYNSHRAIDVRH